jgi:hypothetical protein
MTKIKPLSKQEDFIDPEHKFMKTFTINQDHMTDDEGGSG